MLGKITVHIRFKPGIAKDDIWFYSDDQLYYIKDNKKHIFSCFNSVFFSSDTRLFYLHSVSSFIDYFIKGTNVTVFAYGQTGSGKTYTMFGENNDGIIYYALQDILPSKVSVSCFEIYNEKIYDLSTKNEIRIYNDGQKSVISNLHTRSIETMEQAINFLVGCNFNKTTDSTEYNEKSSRSHTVIQIRKEKTILSFIDLAGSERASKNQNRCKEGAYINRSLLSLSTVIHNSFLYHQEHL